MKDMFYVVETHDDIYLGRIEFLQDSILIKNGFRGHPVHLYAEDIVQMYPAHMHPAVVVSSNYIKASS